MIRSLLILVFFATSPVHAEAPTPTAVEDETPVVLEEIAGDRELTGSRPWRAPHFEDQTNALGWTPDVFAVPKGLEVPYQFWLDIYTKYSTDQGLLHDSELIDCVYAVLDFTHISARADLNESQKSALRTKAVKEAKKNVVAMLKKLQDTKDPSSLTPEEKKVWDAFEKRTEKKKFIEASGKTRLRFQLGQRDRMIQGIFFSGRYLEDYEKIFEEAGLPMELTRLPFVESSFNVLARSKVGASGLWQIMRYTSRPFMKVDNTIDKRNDPAEAVRLAARLMRMNYNMLESWPLAITGYNHGPAGVLRITKMRKTRELGELVQDYNSRRHLGFASRNFYVSFLAALEAERHAPQYFGSVLWSKPLVGTEVKLARRVQWNDIVRWFDDKDKVAQIYNPQITASARKFGRFIPAGTKIIVPTGKVEVVNTELAAPLATRQSVASIKPAVVANSEHEHIVEKGETMEAIAREYGVSLKELLALNQLDTPDKLKIGQKLKIP